MVLEIMWNIHCKSLRKKGQIYLPVQEVSFRAVDEKIRTCGRRRIDRGHNVVCDIGSNVTVLDVGFKIGDAASSYSGCVG